MKIFLFEIWKDAKKFFKFLLWVLSLLVIFRIIGAGFGLFDSPVESLIGISVICAGFFFCFRGYVDEFTFRLNAGKVSRHTTERLDSFVSAVAGKRITYKKLTKGTTWFDADVQREANAAL